MGKLVPTITTHDVSSLIFLTELSTYRKSTRYIGKQYPQDYVNLVHVTSFLSNAVTPAQRLWHISNAVWDVPKCECGNPTLWNRVKKNYSLWCSITCKNKSSIYKDKVKNTCIKKYGTDSYTASEDFRKKYVNTMLAKYGTDHYLKNDAKKHETQTLLKQKYNYITPFELSEVKNKCKNTFNRKYGCHPTQRRFSHKTQTLINDREWLFDQHINQQKTLSEICGALENYDQSSLSDIFKKFGIPIFNMAISASERQLHNLINEYELIKTNIRNIIDPYELDIFIPSKQLAIEYCGVYWHNELHKHANYHRMKYDLCKSKGIRLITIFEDEWLQNRILIEKKLRHVLGASIDSKIFARKCHVKTVDNQMKEHFFEVNHSQGNGPSSINLGLFHENELIACIGFIQEKDGIYNLSRYATSMIVTGGFTKLLTYFERQYHPKQIYTFADLRWSEGDLYKNNGFILDKELSPDYSYVINDKRIHKFNFRHRRLAKILENYDPKLSEHQNCLNHGIYRIYDCGKLKFIKKCCNLLTCST